MLAVTAAPRVDSAEGTNQHIVPPATDPGWQPTAEQKQRIEQLTRDYFAARDGNRHEEAYSRFSPRLKQDLPFTTYRRMLEDFNAMSGQVQGRYLRLVTWYKDPPRAGPGLYAAVDYSSQFPNLVLHCGFVVWHQQPDGSFLLIREESNAIDNATAAKMKPGDFERLRSQFRC